MAEDKEKAEPAAEDVKTSPDPFHPGYRLVGDWNREDAERVFQEFNLTPEERTIISSAEWAEGRRPYAQLTALLKGLEDEFYAIGLFDPNSTEIVETRARDLFENKAPDPKELFFQVYGGPVIGLDWKIKSRVAVPAQPDGGEEVAQP